MFDCLGSGDVVISKKFSKNGSTPKLVKADPKNTGVNSPVLTFSTSNSSPAISRSSISSINLSWSADPKISLNLSSSTEPSIASTSVAPWLPPLKAMILSFFLS